MKKLALLLLLSLAAFSLAVPYIVLKQPGGGYGVNNTNPLPLAGQNHTANWSGGATNLQAYKFQSNLTTCASTGTMTNTSASGILFSTTNRSNSTNVTMIPANCEGKTIGWRFFANDTSNVWNSTSDIHYYNVQNVNPVISSMRMNITDWTGLTVLSTNENTQICVNATVTDVGSGVDPTTVRAIITWPNGTAAIGLSGYPLDNLTSKGTCGGGASVFSAFVGVGSTPSPPNFYINSTSANDKAGNSVINTTLLQVRVNPPPKFPAVGANTTIALPQEEVMFNATITDDFKISGYIFSWMLGGASCATTTNDSWVSFTANNTNASLTKRIPNACEGIGTKTAKFYANDSNDAWNESSVITETIGNVNPIIFNMHTNVTQAENGTQICVNATATDVGIGINASNIHAVILWPNASSTSSPHYPLDNLTSKGTCGGGGNIFSAFISVGSSLSPPNLTIQNWTVTDLLGNLGRNNTIQLNVEIIERPTVSPIPSTNALPTLFIKRLVQQKFQQNEEKTRYSRADYTLEYALLGIALLTIAYLASRGDQNK